MRAEDVIFALSQLKKDGIPVLPMAATYDQMMTPTHYNALCAYHITRVKAKSCVVVWNLNKEVSVDRLHKYIRNFGQCYVANIKFDLSYAGTECSMNAINKVMEYCNAAKVGLKISIIPTPEYLLRKIAAQPLGEFVMLPLVITMSKWSNSFTLSAYLQGLGTLLLDKKPKCVIMVVNGVVPERLKLFWQLFDVLDKVSCNRVHIDIGHLADQQFRYDIVNLVKAYHADSSKNWDISVWQAESEVVTNMKSMQQAADLWLPIQTYTHTDDRLGFASTSYSSDFIDQLRVLQPKKVILGLIAGKKPDEALLKRMVLLFQASGVKKVAFDLRMPHSAQQLMVLDNVANAVNKELPEAYVDIMKMSPRKEGKKEFSFSLTRAAMKRSSNENVFCQEFASWLRQSHARQACFLWDVKSHGRDTAVPSVDAIQMFFTSLSKAGVGLFVIDANQKGKKEGIGNLLQAVDLLRKQSQPSVSIAIKQPSLANRFLHSDKKLRKHPLREKPSICSAMQFSPRAPKLLTDSTPAVEAKKISEKLKINIYKEVYYANASRKTGTSACHITYNAI